MFKKVIFHLWNEMKWNEITTLKNSKKKNQKIQKKDTQPTMTNYEPVGIISYNDSEENGNKRSLI